MRKRTKRKVWALIDPTQHAIIGASITHREKLSKVQNGRKLSEATRQKMSDGLVHRLTSEYRNKLSESAKKAWAKRKGLL